MEPINTLNTQRARHHTDIFHQLYKIIRLYKQKSQQKNTLNTTLRRHDLKLYIYTEAGYTAPCSPP